MDELLKDQSWTTESMCDGEAKLKRCIFLDDSQITVLDRLTGWGDGIRDVETGYRNADGEFWLASGNFDIRNAAGEGATVQDAVELIKKNANTCVGI